MDKLLNQNRKPLVHNCKYVALSGVLTDTELETFQDCEWNNFTFGDCDKSLLSRDRMIEELQGSGENFHSAIKLLKTLPLDCFVEL